MDYRLLVLDKNKTPIGEARSLTSTQWRESYNAGGECKIVLDATGNNREIMREGNFLQLSERPESLAVILAVSVDDNREKATMTVRAKLTPTLLGERVLMWTENIGNAEEGMLRMVESNLRGLPIATAQATGLPEIYGGQISWGSVLEAVEKVAQFSQLGYRVQAGENFSETFQIYKGKDRTDPLSADYVGFFSDTAGILASLTIDSDISKLRNVAVVAGEGEGAARKIVEVDDSAGGGRRELFVDASNVASSYKDPDGSEHTMTAEEYTAALTAKGREKLQETRKGLKLRGVIRQSLLLFGRDYELGDILPLRSDKYGLSVNVRLTEITIIYENSKRIECKLEVVS